MKLVINTKFSWFRLVSTIKSHKFQYFGCVKIGNVDNVIKSQSSLTKFYKTDQKGSVKWNGYPISSILYHNTITNICDISQATRTRSTIRSEIYETEYNFYSQIEQSPWENSKYSSSLFYNLLYSLFFTAIEAL